MPFSSSTARSSTSPSPSASAASSSRPRPSPLFIPELFSRIIYFLLCDDHHHRVTLQSRSPLPAYQRHQYQQQDQPCILSSSRHPAVVDRDQLFYNSQECIRYKQQLQQQQQKQQRAVYRLNRQDYRKEEQAHPYRSSAAVVLGSGSTGASEFQAHPISRSPPSASPSSSSSSSSSLASSFNSNHSSTTSSSSTAAKRKSKDKDKTFQQSSLHHHHHHHHGRHNHQSPGTTIVICAQVCKFWSEQVLPLLWHTVTMDSFDQPHSLFLSAIAARRHMSAPPLEPSSFLSTAVFLSPPLPHPPPHPYPQHRQHFSHPHFHPYYHPHPHSNNTSQTNSRFEMPGRPIASQELHHTSSHFRTLHPSSSSLHSFRPPPQSSHNFSSHPSSSSFTPCHYPLQQQHHHISTGIPSNGHYIQRLQLTSPSSIHHFDHPSVSHLRELSCVVPSKSPSSPTFQAAENIMTRNLCHRLQRLDIGGDHDANDDDYLHPQLQQQQQQQQQQRAASVESMEDNSNCLAGESFLHMHPFDQYYIKHTSPFAVTSGGVTPAGDVGVDHRSDSSSEGHSSADRMSQSYSRSRRRRCSPPSSSSRSSVTTAATANNSPPSRHRRHLNNLRYDRHQDHPKKWVLNHHFSSPRHFPPTDSNSNNTVDQQTPTSASYPPSYHSSSTSSPYLLANKRNNVAHQQQQQQQTLLHSATSSIYNNHDQSSSRLRYHSHDGIPPPPPPTGFFPPPPPPPLRQDLILRQQPVYLTQLSLYQYTFVLEEWVEMMKMMPSLQHLDLEIISVLPSPSSSSSASGTAVDSARSPSSLLLSQTLWNVRSSSPSPPSSSTASSPTLGSRVYHQRQTNPGAHSFTSSCSGSEGGMGISTTSSDDNSNDEEDEGLDMSGLIIDDGQVEENGLGHPQQQQIQQYPPSRGVQGGGVGLTGAVQGGGVGLTGAVAATAGFLTGESDDDDLSLRPPPPIISSPPSTPRWSKTQFDIDSHVTPSSGAPSSRRQKRQQLGYQQHRFDPRTSTYITPSTRHPHLHAHTRRQHFRIPVGENASGYDHHQEEMMTPLVLSLVFQFPAVRSLIFRGPCVLPGILEFLPNIDSLSLLPSPSFGYGRPTPSVPLPAKSRMSSRSFSSAFNSSSSLFLELSQTLQDKYSNITRLVLTEPSIMADLATVRQLPILLRTMPARLVHVELSLRGCSGEVKMEIVQALVESHGHSLQSFVITPLLLVGKVVEDPVVPLPHYPFAQAQQAHAPLDNSYFGFDSHPFPQVQHGHMQQQQQQQQQQMQQQQQRQSPSTYQQHQQPHPPTTQPPHTRSTNPPSKFTTNSFPLLSVLESCPSLLIADSHLPVPLQSVIASFPNWSCHSRLQVLRLELEELSGAGAMDADEEAVMEMFVKSMFIGSRASAPVDVDVEDVVETSEVGESSSWSSGPAGGLGEVSSGGSPFLPLSHSPTSSGSSTPGTMMSSSSSEGSTTALPVYHTLGAHSLLDETGFASASHSPSSSWSSWTTGSASSGYRASSTTSTESTSSGRSVQDVGQSQRREEKQQRVLGQVFAMNTSPLSLSSASSVSTASTGSSSVGARAGGSYFPPTTFTTRTSSSSSLNTTSYSASTSSVSKSTPSSSQSQSQSSQGERKSREAVSSFLSSCSNYQVDVVGKLTALQFLVEHQLATMPRLECFWLGSKMFKIPRRRPASSSSSSSSL